MSAAELAPLPWNKNIPERTDRELTPEETSKLKECELKIEAGQQTFVEVGLALLEIRNSRLYRQTHGNFHEYCQERWNWKRAHAYRLMEAAEVVKDLSPMGDIPSNERVARELATAPVEQRQEVWSKALQVASAKGKATPQVIDVTAAVSEVVERSLTKEEATQARQRDARDAVSRTNNALERLEETICHDPLFASLEPGQKLEAGEIAMRAATKAGRKVSSGDLLRAAKALAEASSKQDEPEPEQPRVRTLDEVVAEVIHDPSDPNFKAPKQSDFQHADGDSDALFHLKMYWRKATKKDRTAFIQWSESNNQKSRRV